MNHFRFRRWFVSLFLCVFVFESAVWSAPAFAGGDNLAAVRTAESTGSLSSRPAEEDALNPQNALTAGAISTKTREIYSLLDAAGEDIKVRWHPARVLMKWVMRDEFTEIMVLSFILSLSNVNTNMPGVVDKHLEQYLPLGESRLPLILRLAAFLGRAASLAYPVGEVIVKYAVKASTTMMANYFFVGENMDEAMKNILAAYESGLKVTVDALGEAVKNEDEADSYAETYAELISRLDSTLPDGETPDISVKLTSLYSAFDPIDPETTKEAVKARLREIFRLAKEKNARATVDMEQYAYKDLTIEIFKELMEEDEFKDFAGAGIVIQAYLVSSEENLSSLIEWSRARVKNGAAPIWVRLVKGAYYEYEHDLAKRKGYEVPVYTDKRQTDKNYAALTRMLFENIDAVRPAIASHNPWNIAYAMTIAEHLGLDKANADRQLFEFQFLAGLAETKARVIAGMGYRAVLYGPYGKYAIGMPYFVRRLLECSSNVSVLGLEAEGKQREEVINGPYEAPERPFRFDPDADDAVKMLSGGEMPIAPVENAQILEKSRDPIVMQYVKAAVSLSEQKPPFIRQVPGEPAEYFYLPGGAGVLVAEEGTTKDEFLRMLSAAIMSDSRVEVRAHDSVRPIAENALRELWAAGIPGKGLVLAEGLDTRDLAGRRDIKWVAVTGNKRKVDTIRQQVYALPAEGKKLALKRVITEPAPAPVFLKKFLRPKTVVVNTTHLGQVSPPAESEGDFTNTPAEDFSRPKVRQAYQEGLEKVRRNIKDGRYKNVPLIIDGKPRVTDKKIISHNPSNFKEVIASVSMATKDDVEDAVSAARKNFEEWNGLSSAGRKEVLQAAAEKIRERRFELAALMTLEVGKSWPEAMGDVEEAIDMLMYYPEHPEMIDGYLQAWMDKASGVQGRGVAAIISPWNFPLAILVGMTAGNLAAGNTVIIKPASQATAMAYEFAEIMQETLREHTLPPGIVNFLPGRGREIGPVLSSHKDVDVLAFTGSEETGLDILRRAAESEKERDFPKNIICELGGKDTMIIDSSADIDKAVEYVVRSAFGYAGQKCSACSRVVVLEDVYDEFKAKLAMRIQSLRMGPAEDAGSFLTPVVDETQKRNIEGFIERARRDGTVKEVCAYNGPQEAQDPMDTGYFVAPVVFETQNRQAEIYQEEIFGPVLTLYKAKNFDEALEAANDSRFALTGGIVSQTPEHIARAKREFNVGIMYVNRGITGAMVGQPFGGEDNSGLGSRAGSPDYLPHFLRMLPAGLTPAPVPTNAPATSS